MREIKFRAWDNSEKKWLLGYEYSNLGGFSMFGETMLFNEWSSIINRFILQQKDRNPEDLILMQYTGLKDKNGKEIYEGDIVKCCRYIDSYSVSVVTYQRAMFRVIENAIGSTYLGQNGEDILEIIGNIYETHELLNQSNASE